MKGLPLYVAREIELDSLKFALSQLLAIGELLARVGDIEQGQQPRQQGLRVGLFIAEPDGHHYEAAIPARGAKFGIRELLFQRLKLVPGRVGQADSVVLVPGDEIGGKAAARGRSQPVGIDQLEPGKHLPQLPGDELSILGAAIANQLVGVAVGGDIPMQVIKRVLAYLGFGLSEQTLETIGPPPGLAEDAAGLRRGAQVCLAELG